MLKGVSPWVLSKNRIFYQGYFLGKLIKNSLVFDVLDRKECFLDHKNEVLKKPRKWKYFKGVSPWFVSKNRIECFLDHKNEVLKKPRKWKYFKGVSPWFVSKNRMFY